jgi:hypothetical protein
VAVAWLQYVVTSTSTSTSFLCTIVLTLSVVLVLHRSPCIPIPIPIQLGEPNAGPYFICFFIFIDTKCKLTRKEKKKGAGRWVA